MTATTRVPQRLTPHACVVCGARAGAYFEDGAHGWRYCRCAACGLVFRTDPALTQEEERRHYSKHENLPAQDGYRRFLAPAVEAVAAVCAPGDEGLDFGCGPGPVLALMLGERGLKVALHDPHFAASAHTLSRRYRFVVCTEAAEHFERPAADFARLASLLEPGGWLVLMTRLWSPELDFARWSYRQDPTHRRFYAERTLRWLAGRHGWSVERLAPDLTRFRRLSS